jgi:hypothetical protein
MSRGSAIERRRLKSAAKSTVGVIKEVRRAEFGETSGRLNEAWGDPEMSCSNEKCGVPKPIDLSERLFKPCTALAIIPVRSRR